MPIPSETLAQCPLVLAALSGGAIVADQRFAPGATVSVGSNSKNDLIIDPRFELTSYTLLTAGSVLHVLPPLHLQAWVWLEGEAVELKGYVRDLRPKRAIPEALPLASERFVVSYATGIAFLGRFELPTPNPESPIEPK